MERLNGFLLDTNHLCKYFAKDQTFLARLASTPPERQIFWTSAVAIGETSAGYQMTPNHDPAVEQQFRSFLVREFLHRPGRGSMVLPIDEHVSEEYAKIVGPIVCNHRRAPKQRTEDILNQQGVDVNDAWICATAIASGLTLLTSDRMDAIRSVIPHGVLTTDNWI